MLILIRRSPKHNDTARMLRRAVRIQITRQPSYRWQAGRSFPAETNALYVRKFIGSWGPNALDSGVRGCPSRFDRMFVALLCNVQPETTCHSLGPLIVTAAPPLWCLWHPAATDKNAAVAFCENIGGEPSGGLWLITDRKSYWARKTEVVSWIWRHSHHKT